VTEGGKKLGEITVEMPVPQWYKVSINAIEEGGKVIKHGYPIGVSVRYIPPGYVVHVTNVRLREDMDFKMLARQGFILGEALKDVEKGEKLLVGRSFRPIHPAFAALRRGDSIGEAITPIAHGGYIRLGNIVDIERKLGWNEKYRRLTRDFYRFLKMSFEDFSQVP